MTKRTERAQRTKTTALPAVTVAAGNTPRRGAEYYELPAGVARQPRLSAAASLSSSESFPSSASSAR